MAKHNIQKTHIHIFHNILLREVAIIMDVASDCDIFKHAKVQKQLSRGFCKKDILRNFAKITGKHLCQSIL